MRRGRLALLVLLYVALDFANPLMPGAVRLVEGCVEAVQAERGRADSGPAQADRPVTADRSDRVAVRSVAPRRLPRPAVPRPAIVAVQRTPEPASDSAASSEDH